MEPFIRCLIECEFLQTDNRQGNLLFRYFDIEAYSYHEEGSSNGCMCVFNKCWQYCHPSNFQLFWSWEMVQGSAGRTTSNVEGISAHRRGKVVRNISKWTLIGFLKSKRKGREESFHSWKILLIQSYNKDSTPDCISCLVYPTGLIFFNCCSLRLFMVLLYFWFQDIHKAIFFIITQSLHKV